MLKLTTEDIATIVKNDMPGYHLSAESEQRLENPDSEIAVDTAPLAPIEESTPDLQTLREKYLHIEAPAVSSEQVAEIAQNVIDAVPAVEAEDEIVAATPNESAHPWDRSARPKAAVISGAEHKIIGRQG